MNRKDFLKSAIVTAEEATQAGQKLAGALGIQPGVDILEQMRLERMDHYRTSDGRIFTGEFLQDPGARNLVGDEYDELMAEYKRRRSHERRTTLQRFPRVSRRLDPAGLRALHDSAQ